MDYKTYIKNGLKKVNLRYVLQLVILDILTLCVAVFGIVSIDIFIFGAFFILLPAYFSTYVCCSAIIRDQQITNTEFFRGMQNYYNFKSPFYGVFNAIIAFLKSMLIAFIASTIFSYVYSYVIGDEFFSAVEMFLEAAGSNDLEVASELLETNDILKIYINLSSLVSLASGTFIFYLHIAKYTLGIENRAGTAPLGPRMSNIVFKTVYRANRKEIGKDFFSNLWWCVVGCAIVLVGGMVVPYILGLEAIYSFLIGMYLSFVFISFCLPRFFFFVEAFNIKYNKQFTKQFAESVDDLVQTLSTTTQINKEEKDAYERILKSLQKSLKKDDEDSKDNNE